jgi:5-methylcytosine-specific restriction endonuclease McrA
MKSNRQRCAEWRKNHPDKAKDKDRRARNRRKEKCSIYPELCQQCGIRLHVTPINQFKRCYQCNVANVITGLRKRARDWNIECNQDKITALRQYLIHTIRIVTHCPYTGILLIPGVNLVLDHKIPICKSPALIFEPTNLEWVSDIYNRAKGDMTSEEFNVQYKIVIISSDEAQNAYAP